MLRETGRIKTQKVHLQVRFQVDCSLKSGNIDRNKFTRTSVGEMKVLTWGYEGGLDSSTISGTFQVLLNYNSHHP